MFWESKIIFLPGFFVGQMWFRRGGVPYPIYPPSPSHHHRGGISAIVTSLGLWRIGFPTGTWYRWCLPTHVLKHIIYIYIYVCVFNFIYMGMILHVSHYSYWYIIHDWILLPWLLAHFLLLCGVPSSHSVEGSTWQFCVFYTHSIYCAYLYIGVSSCQLFGACGKERRCFWSTRGKKIVDLHEPSNGHVPI